MVAVTAVPVAAPADAVMVVVPTLAPVTTPEATLATVGSLLVHETTLPVTGDPDRFSTRAVMVDVVPDATVIGVGGVRAMLAGVLSGAPSPPHASARIEMNAERRKEGIVRLRSFEGARETRTIPSS
jgi:hypothetical protein